MFFRLRNALATFQKAMDVIISSVKWQSSLAYLVYIGMFSKTVQEHPAHLRWILKQLQNAGVTRKLRILLRICEEIHLSGPRRTIPQIPDRGSNDKGNLRTTLPYNTDRRAIFPRLGNVSQQFFHISRNWRYRLINHCETTSEIPL